jgi:hypothetical protein
MNSEWPEAAFLIVAAFAVVTFIGNAPPTVDGLLLAFGKIMFTLICMGIVWGVLNVVRSYRGDLNGA